MNTVGNPKSCPEETAFVRAIQTEGAVDPLYYAFNTYQGRLAAEFSLMLGSTINTANDNLSKASILNMNPEGKTLGLISANLLHKICGPYPHIESPNTDPFDEIVRTFLLPVFTLLVLVTNACVCVVFSRRHMLNPVFLILLVIGMMELANGLLPLPYYLAQSWFQHRIWWESLPRQNFTVPEQLLEKTQWTLGPIDIYQTSSNTLASQTSAWTTVFLPTITHTCSVWLTITLALQRLIYVSRPHDTSRICTLNRSLFISLIILFGSFMIHLPLLNSRFVEFRPVRLRSKTDKSLAENQICLSQLVLELPLIVMKCHNLKPQYMLTYFYARIILIHMMPCGILAILTSLLVYKMRQITQLRKRLNASSPKLKPNESGSTDSEKLSHKLFLNQPRKYMELCCKRFVPSWTLYTNDSVVDNPIANQTQMEIPQHPTSNIKERKRNSIGNPQTISRMLIVVLIKFIAMHLPNAIALLVYVLITLQKRDSSSSFAVTLNNTDRLDQSTPVSQPLFLTPTPNSTSFPAKPTETSQPNYWSRLSTMCNLIILVSYQLNFLIYYTMSTAFRETFKQICSAQITCHSCLNSKTKHFPTHPILVPNDTNQSNQTMNQTESGDNDKNLARQIHTRQIIPVLIESQID